MPRKRNTEGLTARGLKPRREDISTVNMKHERFAAEYLVDFDCAEAYLRAGYKAKDHVQALKMGRRLLNNVKVWEIIHTEHIKRISECKLDAEKTVMELQYCYLEASRDRDWPSAIMALKELGKHFGIFEAHQKAKRNYSADDVAAMKARLEAAGWNYSRKSYEETPSTN